MTHVIRFRLPISLAIFFSIGLSGCTSPSTSRSNTPGRDSGTFERILGIEDEGRYREALRAYKAIAADEDRSRAERVRARFRIARCFEEQNEFREAREAYHAVLSLPYLQADEGRLPVPGTVGIHLRKQAEDGLARIGGNPAPFYSSLALLGTAPERRVAVRSLGRLHDGRGRSALLTVANDGQADETLREEARKALLALDRAEDREHTRK